MTTQEFYEFQNTVDGTIAYKLAHAAATDEGNRNMRKAGRTAWNEEDFNVAAETIQQLMDAV